MTKSTLEIVREVFVEKLESDPETVVLQASLSEDLGADSLDAIEVIMALEEIYGREFEGEDIENLKTVGDVVELIDRLTHQEG
ncbi:MAG: acyl carrier protein [Coriobacteriales bacterium]|jgi:acyl carrier protein|nr:acyl carrier protein [Coriobacteriales bacterium]